LQSFIHYVFGQTAEIWVIGPCLFPEFSADRLTGLLGNYPTVTHLTLDPADILYLVAFTHIIIVIAGDTYPYRETTKDGSESVILGHVEFSLISL
jgi:hypothetical protein